MRQKILFLFMVTSIAASSYVTGSEALDIIRVQNRLLNEAIEQRDALETKLQEVIDADLPSRLEAIPRLRAEVAARDATIGEHEVTIGLRDDTIVDLNAEVVFMPLRNATIARLRSEVVAMKIKASILRAQRNLRDAAIVQHLLDVAARDATIGGLQPVAALMPLRDATIARLRSEAAAVRIKVATLRMQRNLRDATIAQKDLDIAVLQAEVARLRALAPVLVPQAVPAPPQLGALAAAPQQVPPLQNPPVLHYATWVQAREAGLTLSQFKNQ